MKKLTALLLCLVMVVSMFAACGDDTPADTTAAANNTTTKAPNTTEKAPETTVPGGDNTTTEPVGGDTTTEKPVDPPKAPVDLEDLIPELPIEEQLAKDDIGAKDAGVVEEGYVPVDGTVGISSLAEITDPDGKYFLKNDISANETTIPEFYGILDCCGYSITTSEPLFVKLGGAVINLNLAGDITYSVEAKAPLANELIDNAIILNVKNTANVTVSAESTEVGVNAGGFAVVCTGANVVIANCEFAGTIVNNYAFGGNNRKTGGFIGMIKVSTEEGAENPAVDFIYCTVSGTVSASSHVGGFVGESETPTTLNVAGCLAAGTITGTYEGVAGGLIGYISGSSSCEHYFVNCAHTGTVRSEGGYYGGLIGRSNTSGSVHVTTIEWCANYGEITGCEHGGGIAGSVKGMVFVTACVNFVDIESFVIKVDGTPDPTKKRHYVGGIIGYVETNSTIHSEFVDCVNYGNLDAGAHNARLGGIVGHSEKNLAIWRNCVNFGNITSNYVAPDGNTGDHRIGGIASGGNSNFEFYDCVNFGDMRIQMGKWGQPSGGIVGYVTNSGLFAMENCLNYGDLDVTVPTLAGTSGYYNTAAAGLAGRVTGVAGIIVKNCLAAGELKSDFIVANFVNWEKASGFLEDDMVIENNYYIPQTVKEGQLYGNFLYDDLATSGVPNKINKVYEKYETEACGKAVTMANIADSTTAGLAAVMNAAAGETLFQYAEVKMADGVTVVKCVIPVAVAELIADNIIG